MHCENAQLYKGGGSHFENLNVVKIPVPGDGNCYFHSIMLGTVIDYIENPHLRNAYAISFRHKLADFLTEIDEQGRTNYSKLSRGEIEEYAKHVPAFSLPNLCRLLKSNSCVGQEVLEASSNFLDVNIIIWDEKKKDVYRHGDKELLYKPERSTVILTYKPIHYDLLGTKCPITGKIFTHFTHENHFVQKILEIW